MEKSPFTREHRLLIAMLRERRRAASLTQAQIAKKLGLTQSVVSKWERGDRRVDLIQLLAWCRATGDTLSGFAADFESRVKRKRKR